MLQDMVVIKLDTMWESASKSIHTHTHTHTHTSLKLQVIVNIP